MRIAIIGAGAGGCFAAIQMKRWRSELDVTIYESGCHPLRKVGMTGGGRCNLTNTFDSVGSLEEVYPRGSRLMKRLFYEFSPRDAYEWWEREGVRLMVEEEGRVYPRSEDAKEVVRKLTQLMYREGVVMKTNHRVDLISRAVAEEPFILSFTDKNMASVETDVVVVATGSPTQSTMNMLREFDVNFSDPVPSLFGMRVAENSLTELMGASVENVSVGIVGTKHRASGSLVVTHWGVSGPAILRLSSYAARTLHDCDYHAQLSINWMGETTEKETMEWLNELATDNSRKMLSSAHPMEINSRLWNHLLLRSHLDPAQRWAELGRKSLSRLATTLCADTYTIIGRNTHKEEFVTSGGVSLKNIDPHTLECTTIPRLYFVGEMLNVDGVTGGFNLQAAWTTAYVVAKSL